MAWIRIVEPAEATGLLRRLYDTAVKRAGRVYNVISLQSLAPRVLQCSTRLYTELMHSPEAPLTRAQREMIAVAVSRANECEY